MTGLPLIYNPTAGGRRKDIGGKLLGCFEELGAQAELMPTSAAGDATAFARKAAEQGAPRLVAAGGDGTVNEVINGLAGSPTELAVIPTGTANVLALELKIPLDMASACRLAISGTSVEVDLGQAGDRYFILMAGAGFDALVIKNLNPILKKTIRRAAFPLSGIRTFLGEKLPLLSVSSGDLVTEGYFVVASNSRYYGGRFGPNPNASMSDGLLDVCVLKGRSLPEMLDFWIGALSSGTIDTAVAEYFRATELEIGCPTGAPVPVQTDGEVTGRLPMRITAHPKFLKICPGGENW